MKAVRVSCHHEEVDGFVLPEDQDHLARQCGGVAELVGARDTGELVARAGDQNVLRSLFDEPVQYLKRMVVPSGENQRTPNRAKYQPEPRQELVVDRRKSTPSSKYPLGHDSSGREGERIRAEEARATPSPGTRAAATAIAPGGDPRYALYPRAILNRATTTS